MSKNHPPGTPRGKFQPSHVPPLPTETTIVKEKIEVQKDTVVSDGPGGAPDTATHEHIDIERETIHTGPPEDHHHHPHDHGAITMNSVITITDQPLAAIEPIITRHPLEIKQFPGREDNADYIKWLENMVQNLMLHVNGRFPDQVTAYNHLHAMSEAGLFEAHQ